MAEPIVSPVQRARRRSRRLRAVEWLALVEACGLLAVSAAAIRALPFRRVVRLASPAVRARPAPLPADTVRIAAWAVEAAARRVPWRTVCFQKGLALHWMLRRRGVASFLHYGVGKDEAAALAAHVWIVVDDAIVQGGDVVDRFRCLAIYPPR